MNLRRSIKLLSILGITSFVAVIGVTAPVDAVQPSATNDATVVEVSHDRTVTPDGSFEITVETNSSAGTTVALEPEGFDVELSSKSGKINEGRVRFLDINAGDSKYTIKTEITGGEGGDTGKISVWVNSGDRADAADISTSTFEISDTDEDTSSNDDGRNSSRTNTSNGSSNFEGTNQNSSAGSTAGDKQEENTTVNSTEWNQKDTESAETSNGSGTESEGIENRSERDPNTGVDNTVPGFHISLAVVSIISCGLLMKYKSLSENLTGRR